MKHKPSYSQKSAKQNGGSRSLKRVVRSAISQLNKARIAIAEADAEAFVSKHSSARDLSDLRAMVEALYGFAWHIRTEVESTPNEKVSSASAGGWEAVNHPTHYGGADDAYESIKVIEAWKLGFHLGNTVKYISRAERKGAPLQDLKKAAWYLAREIERRGGRQRQNEGDELRAGGNLNKHD